MSSDMGGCRLARCLGQSLPCLAVAGRVCHMRYKGVSPAWREYPFFSWGEEPTWRFPWNSDRAAEPLGWIHGGATWMPEWFLHVNLRSHPSVPIVVGVRG